MKPYSGYQAKRSGNSREILPAGGYVAKIISARVDETKFGDKLIVAFDIAEGDYRGFFKKDFDSNTSEDKKWRGVYRANVPTEDGSERDDWNKRTMNNVAACFEESNQGYTWDWDESRLKGLIVGVLFRNKEWEVDGRTGWTTECCALTDAQSIRDGKFKTPKDKPLANHSSVSVVPAEEEDSGELPF